MKLHQFDLQAPEFLVVIAIFAQALRFGGFAVGRNMFRFSWRRRGAGLYFFVRCSALLRHLVPPRDGQRSRLPCTSLRACANCGGEISSKYFLLDHFETCKSQQTNRDGKKTFRSPATALSGRMSRFALLTWWDGAGRIYAYRPTGRFAVYGGLLPVDCDGFTDKQGNLSSLVSHR
jgi:hypothetical protein